MLKTTLATTLATALIFSPLPALAETASAATVQFAQRRAVPRDRFQQVYSQGYQAGMREGQRDARSRRGGDYRRHNAYRRGGAWGSGRSAEADAFRRGFAEGYTQAYRQMNSRGWGNSYPSYPGPGRVQPGYPRGGGYYGQGGPYNGQGYPGARYGNSPAAQRGFDEGYREGADAARRNRRYDPVGEKHYRDGDRGYNSRFGSREVYKQHYRQAFRQGYDLGYREGRYR